MAKSSKKIDSIVTSIYTITWSWVISNYLIWSHSFRFLSKNIIINCMIITAQSWSNKLNRINLDTSARIEYHFYLLPRTVYMKSRQYGRLAPFHKINVPTVTTNCTYVATSRTIQTYTQLRLDRFRGDSLRQRPWNSLFSRHSPPIEFELPVASF